LENEIGGIKRKYLFNSIMVIDKYIVLAAIDYDTTPLPPPAACSPNEEEKI
jgi:hypothetical protein